MYESFSLLHISDYSVLIQGHSRLAFYFNVQWSWVAYAKQRRISNVWIILVTKVNVNMTFIFFNCNVEAYLGRIGIPTELRTKVIHYLKHLFFISNLTWTKKVIVKSNIAAKHLDPWVCCFSLCYIYIPGPGSRLWLNHCRYTSLHSSLASVRRLVSDMTMYLL